jgi:hypothetical protein
MSKHNATHIHCTAAQKASGRRPTQAWPMLMISRLESNRNPARKPEIRPGRASRTGSRTFAQASGSLAAGPKFIVSAEFGPEPWKHLTSGIREHGQSSRPPSLRYRWRGDSGLEGRRELEPNWLRTPPGRKSGFRAGFRPDSNWASIEIQPAFGRPGGRF